MSVTFIANVMTRDRFKEILSNLHFSNNNEALPKDHPNHDRAFKVRWLIDYLNERFLQSVDPEANQSVDEHMVKFKGRNIMRQHIHNKPIEWGFKMWYRCAPKSGYLYEMDIYTGKKEVTEFGLGESVVLKLTEKLNGSFCRIFFDNFFTSPSLMRKLTENDLYGIGVVRQCRKLLPKKEETEKKKSKQVKSKNKTKELVHGSTFSSESSFDRGDSDFLVSKDGLVALRWKDSKVVMLLTNCMDPSMMTNVERRQKGKAEKLKLPCPVIIKEYNLHMNGVNLHDQLKTCYEVDRKAKFRYYLRIFFDLMDSVVVNAHIIYKKEVNARMNLLDFKVSLSEALVNGFSSRKRKFTADTPQLALELPLSMKEPDHIVQFTEKRSRCQYCFDEGKKDVKCFTYCKTCNVHICVQKDRNCFKMYHSF